MGSTVSREVAGMLPRGELHLGEGAGHMPWFDDPSAVSAEVARFLAASDGV
jgi:pimeloyl-ACP methyl ester carboxylesterase